MALIEINGKELKTPSKYDAQSSDIVDSGRNIAGYIVSDVVRYDVAKVIMEWNYLTVKEWSDILKIFNPKYGGAFINTVKYLDQCSGVYEERRMYPSDRKAGLINLDADGNPRGWQGCSISLVEV